MSKRGQITIFIIIGIIFLVFILLFSWLRFSTLKETFTAQKVEVSFSAPVLNYIQSCLDKTAEEAVIFIAEHGGYYELPDLADLKFNLPYYLYEGRNNMLSQTEVEEQLSNYINNELPFCLQNFIVFKDSYEIKAGKIRTESKLISEKIIFNLNFPVTVRQGEQEVAIAEFSAEIPVRLKEMRDIIEGYLKMEEIRPDAVCISCILNLAINNNLKAEMFFVRAGEMLFILIDENHKINNANYEFSFMNKYHFEIPEGRTNE